MSTAHTQYRCRLLAPSRLFAPREFCRSSWRLATRHMGMASCVFRRHHLLYLSEYPACHGLVQAVTGHYLSPDSIALPSRADSALLKSCLFSALPKRRICCFRSNSLRERRETPKSQRVARAGAGSSHRNAHTSAVSPLDSAQAPASAGIAWRRGAPSTSAGIGRGGTPAAPRLSRGMGLRRRRVAKASLLPLVFFAGDDA